MLLSIQPYHCAAGELILGEFDKKICLCDWRFRKSRNQIDERIKNELGATFEEKDTTLLRRAKKQLDEYFSGERTEFDLPFLFVGTDFQKRVWEALPEIPSGKTMSFLELARKLGDEKVVRAVTAAIAANALSILIPCHRITGSDGDLAGYGGGLSAKKKLLRIEGLNFGYQLELF
jgi:methylated-DNA-[protein]-cysteine S-methyltransferase